MLLSKPKIFQVGAGWTWLRELSGVFFLQQLNHDCKKHDQYQRCRVVTRPDSSELMNIHHEIVQTSFTIEYLTLKGIVVQSSAFLWHSLEQSIVFICSLNAKRKEKSFQCIMQGCFWNKINNGCNFQKVLSCSVGKTQLI